MERDRHSIYLGISSSPTLEVIEHFWGYRAVEKTPLDLQKFGASREFGIAFKGSFDSEKRVAYHVMFGDGSGNGSENNDGKKIMLALTVEPADGLALQGYVDFEERPGHTDRYTLQGFAGYKQANFRLGVQFAYQHRQVGPGLDDLKLQILSAFGAARLSPKAWGFARVDRQFDPNPEGARIFYIPFDPTSKSTFVVVGIDYSLANDIHLMPNAEFVFYDDNGTGASPDTDVIPRLTFFIDFDLSKSWCLHKDRGTCR